jgi:hypothetical protein
MNTVQLQGVSIWLQQPVDTVAEPDELAHHEKVLAGIDKESKASAYGCQAPEEMPSA